MKFQRAQASIIRSIRQLSLFREWLQLRAQKPLPDISDYTPDTRSGDAADICINGVEQNGDRLRFKCRKAGVNFEAAFGRPIKGAYLDECLDAGMANAARPIWDACIANQLPIYSIVPSADRDGVPVTLEHLYLPFVDEEDCSLRMLASIHAFSEEGRFKREGLVQQNTSAVPLHWAVIVDPAASLVPKKAVEDDFEIVLT